MEGLDNAQHFWGDTTSLQYLPQCLSGYRITRLPQINEQSEQGVLMLSGLLHQLSHHKNHVIATPTLPETTLGLWKHMFCNPL